MSIFFLSAISTLEETATISPGRWISIWDYVICSRAKVLTLACDVLLGSCNVPQIVTAPYQWQDFNFHVDNWKECYFADSFKLCFQIYVWVAKTLHFGLLLPCWYPSLYVVTFRNACWKSPVWNTCTMLHSKAGCRLTTCSRHNEIDRCT